MTARGMPALATARLSLRPFVMADVPAVRRLAGERAVADTTAAIPHPYDDGVAERWIATHQEAWRRRKEVVFAVTLKADGTLIGAAGLVIEREHARAELGYWIGRPFWNRGYATEAARAVVGFGFTALGLHRVHARHFARNPASGRVLRKLGMVHEGRQREHLRRWDGFEDLECYGLLRREFTLPVR